MLRPGHAWIAPGDYHLTVVRDGPQVRVLLNQDPPENSCRPAADVLFRSVARTFGPSALAVVLTGMGQDGLRGCEAIREAGGQVLAQDEATSVVWGMPGFVARAGLADRVLPLALIGPEIVRRVAEPGRGRRPMTAQDFEYVCRLVRDRSAIVLEPGKEYLVESPAGPGRAAAGPRLDRASWSAGCGPAPDNGLADAGRRGDGHDRDVVLPRPSTRSRRCGRRSCPELIRRRPASGGWTSGAPPARPARSRTASPCCSASTSRSWPAGR